MKRLVPFAVCFAALISRADVLPPASPAEMAAATERWLVEGAGARFPDGMADPANDGDFVFVDGTWPLPFRERVGESVALRVSPETGCYEFADPDGTVFWTVVPVAPLTWNWISPFRSPLRPDTQDLYSPFRLAREWLLLSVAEFDSRAESADPLATRHSSLVTREAAGPATSLCFTAFAFTETNLFFTAAWPTNETLPESVLDLYGSTNLLDPRWTFLSSHPATTNPVSFGVDLATLPWYLESAPHVHDTTCDVATNIVLSPLDGATVYTNVVWSCATNRTPDPPGLFRLGTHHDTDGDGLFDAFEKLASGTDPIDPDTDGNGVPDGLTWSEWRSHPLWAENGDGTNLVVFLYEPVTNGFAALRFDDLCIPLSSNAGPWCLCVPTNAVVDCTLVSGADTVAMLWYGPPEAVEWTPANRSAPGPRWTWDVPDDVAVPVWCDRPMSVFGGNSGGGSCRFARPTLRIRSEEPGQEGCLDVCVHGTDGIARFAWSVEPSACTGLWAFATGYLSDSGNGRTFCIDVSDAVPGLAGARTGTLHVGSLQAPFFGDDSLFGTLSGTVSAHRCAGVVEPFFGFCLSCGVAHGASLFPPSCYHGSWCATKTNLLADCDCAEPFVRIGNAGTLRLVGEDWPCCSVHDGFPHFADVLSAPGALHAGISNGVFLAVEPESRSPTIGGFVARCRIYDGDGGTYRDLSVPFTCADLGIDPDFAEMWIPDDAPPAEYFVTNGTLHLARCAAPYPIRLWNESPSDARLVFSFSSPTNGPTVRETAFGIQHSAFSITNAAPFSALNSDTTVYLDASCSNALATLTLTLSDPATNRTFLAESLSVQVVDTDVGEHWRVRSATDRLSWDFSDAPEDVHAYLWRPNADSAFGDLITNTQSKTPSLSLDLPPGDYLLDFYFPRVYDGGFSAAWSTNYLHIRPVPELARDVVGVQCRTDRRVEVALTNGTFHSDVHWTLSPVVANGPRLFATSNSVSGATSMTGCSNVWVSAGTVPGVYGVTASYPGLTNATATVYSVEVTLNQMWETHNPANRIFNPTPKDDKSDVGYQEFDSSIQATYGIHREKLYMASDPNDVFVISLSLLIEPADALPHAKVAAYESATEQIKLFSINGTGLAILSLSANSSLEEPEEIPVSIRFDFDGDDEIIPGDFELAIPVYSHSTAGETKFATIFGLGPTLMQWHENAVRDMIGLYGIDPPVPSMISTCPRSFLLLFVDGTTNRMNSAFLPDVTETVSFSAFSDPMQNPDGFSEWLTHNSGADFSDAGVAVINRYCWSTNSFLSRFLAERTPFVLKRRVANSIGYVEFPTETGTNLLQFVEMVVLPEARLMLDNASDGAEVTLPSSNSFYCFPTNGNPAFQSESPDWVPETTVVVGQGAPGRGRWGALVDEYLGGGDQFQEFNANGTIGRGRVTNLGYSFTIRKEVNSNWFFPDSTNYVVVSARVKCRIDDLYDFNYEDGEIAAHAAAMQIRHGNGSMVSVFNDNRQTPVLEGHIFMDRIEIDHEYEFPFRYETILRGDLNGNQDEENERTIGKDVE